MLSRLSFGLIKGSLLGGILAVLLIQGGGWTSFNGSFLAYPICLVLGVLAGLVAGKPFWARGAAIEVGLKALFGSGLACLGMFLLRRYANLEVDLSRFGVGQGAIAELPITSLPTLGVAIAMLFELDNTGDPTPSASPAKQPKERRQRVQAEQGSAAAEELDEEIAHPEAGRKARR